MVRGECARGYDDRARAPSERGMTGGDGTAPAAGVPPGDGRPGGGPGRLGDSDGDGEARSGARSPRGRGGGLSEADRAAVAAAVAALPPITEAQADPVCEVIVYARQRWRRGDRARPGPTGRRA